ncbi:MAG: HAMP domain-containing histidine kinase [Acidimicrobiia bacterium]|nr:HAMP domain-containing histidine kinase [Acidimicrobiia bacterium]
MTDERAPVRFRRRLTFAFVVVVALSTGVVGLVTFFVAQENRARNFRTESIGEARFTVAVAPLELDAESFERLRLGYESRSDANLLAVADTFYFSSARNLTSVDIPEELTDLLAGPGDLRTVRTTINGDPTLVVGAKARTGDTYYSFFSMDQMEDSRRELARIVFGSWAATVGAAGAVSWWVTRRTLRPVADVASTAEAIASGDLAARLPPAAGDELGSLAVSFNHMADEVQDMVGRLEAAAQRERQFTADIAHELRTPLTGMSATASILREQLGDLPTSLRRPTTILVGDVDRIRDLVLELLELARLDAGSELPRLEPLRLDDAVRSVLRGLDAPPDVVVTVEPGTTVLADPTRLRRILTNLVSNAIVHGGGGVRVVAGPGADGWAEVHVIDSGPGIAEDELAQVFDRFYKSERSRAAGGSGLGLAISREHARSQGGDIAVINEPGRGARFTLRLPRS